MARSAASVDPAGSRTPLNRSVVLDRALAIADAQGLDGLSIRRLAQELGVTPMALYWHFKSKDDLLAALADRVVQEVDLAVDVSRPWQEQVRGLVESLVVTLRRHPPACPLLTTREATGEHTLAALEVVLDVLRRGGFSPEEATQLTRHVIRTACALVAGEPYAVPSEDQDRAAAQRRTRFLLESLPPDRYPRLIEAAAPLSSCEDPDGYYAFGVDLMMASIEAMSRRTAP